MARLLLVPYPKGVFVTRFYLARHGQNIDNANGILNGHRDLPLTELGEKQASNLAKAILEEGISFDVVYSSPLARAFHTAETITRLLCLDQPIVLADLIERDFGELTGQPQSSILERVPESDLIRTPTVQYYLEYGGCETFPQALVRARGLLTRLRHRHPDESVLLVAHGDIGKMIYCAYYDLDWRDVLTSFHFGNSELLELSEDVTPATAHVFQQEQANS